MQNRAIVDLMKKNYTSKEMLYTVWFMNHDYTVINDL